MLDEPDVGEPFFDETQQDITTTASLMWSARYGMEEIREFAPVAAFL